MQPRVKMGEHGERAKHGVCDIEPDEPNTFWVLENRYRRLVGRTLSARGGCVDRALQGSDSQVAEKAIIECFVPRPDEPGVYDVLPGVMLLIENLSVSRRDNQMHGPCVLYEVPLPTKE